MEPDRLCHLGFLYMTVLDIGDGLSLLFEWQGDIGLGQSDKSFALVRESLQVMARAGGRSVHGALKLW
jgi:hypothetical protein